MQATRAQAKGAIALVVVRIEPRGRAPTAPPPRSERLVLPVDAWTAIPCMVVCGHHALLLAERLRTSSSHSSSASASASTPIPLHFGPPALLYPTARHAASRRAALAALAALPPGRRAEQPEWLVGPPYLPLPIPLPLGATDWMVQVPMPELTAQPPPRAASSTSHYWGKPTTAAGQAATRKAEQMQMQAQMQAQSEEEEQEWEGSREDLVPPAAVRSEASTVAARQRGGLGIFADARAPLLPESRIIPFGPGF